MTSSASSGTGRLTWLHLSDIHFGHESYATTHEILGKIFREDLPQLRQQAPELWPELVLVTGDVAFSGGCKRDDEYQEARRFFIDLMAALRLPMDRLFLVPGNHDVDRSVHEELTVATRERLIGEAKRGDLEGAGKLIEEGLRAGSGDSVLQKLLDRQSSFYELTRELGCGSELSTPALFWTRRVHDLPSFGPVRLIGLNSAWLCNRSDERNNIILGRWQTQKALAEIQPDELVVLLSHHPLDWLTEAEKNDAGSRIRQACHVHLHGHIHQSGVELLETARSRLRTFSGGGAIQELPNHDAYSIVRLVDARAEKGEIWLRRYSRQEQFWTHDNLTYRRAEQGRLGWGGHGPSRGSEIEPQSSAPPDRRAHASATTLKLEDSLQELWRLQRDRADEASIRSMQERVLEIRRELRDGPDLQPGHELSGRFALLDIAGHGGFGTVWRALDKRSLGPVAVKILHNQHARDGSLIERFQRGAREMLRLSHEHIVRVIQGHTEALGYHYFVMEHIDGSSFEDVILAGGLSHDEALDVIQKVAGALHHAHENNVVHRDVKPSNILLGRDGSVRLTDFDLVRVAGSTGGTRTGALGSVFYTAPELFAGSDADRRCDVYSIGMTAILGLYGSQLPHEALLDPSAVLQHLRCGPRTRWALKQAVERDPRRRYATAGAFSQALSDARRDDSLPIRPSPSSDRPDRDWDFNSKDLGSNE